MDSPGYNSSRADSLINIDLEDCKEPAMDRNQNDIAPAQKTEDEPIEILQDCTNHPTTQPSTTKNNVSTHSDTNTDNAQTHTTSAHPSTPTPTLSTLYTLTTTRLPLLLRTFSMYLTLKTTHSHRLRANQARIATLQARLTSTQTLLDKLLDLQRQGLLSAAETEMVDSAVAQFGEMARELAGVREEAEGLRRQIEGIGLGMFWRGLWG